MPASGWGEYLDTLESYLDQVMVAVKRSTDVEVPGRLASRPADPIPPELLGRATALLVELGQVRSAAEQRREEVGALLLLVGRAAQSERRSASRFVDFRL